MTRLGIIGLSGSGRSTIFAALTGARGEEGEKRYFRSDLRISTVTVRDERIDYLVEIFKPKKTVYAKVEYLLPPDVSAGSSSKSDGGLWNQVRICDALLHVVRNFRSPDNSSPTPEKDFWQLEEEMILSDFYVCEKRLERIEFDRKRGKQPEGSEASLIKSCLESLENDLPLRAVPHLASNPALRGFTFLSAKPLLVIVNNEDDDEALPEWANKPQGVDLTILRGRLEMDIASMSQNEAKEFLDLYHIRESALDRIIKSSYRLLDRISFFTVGSDEVKAWPVTSGTTALDAAGTIHSDIKKGFICAEVISFEDFKSFGSFQEAKKAGAVRLEGKEYMVQDGDIISFRFNL